MQTEQTAAAEDDGYVRGIRTDYQPLYDLAKKHGVSYNEVCAAFREAVAPELKIRALATKPAAPVEPSEKTPWIRVEDADPKMYERVLVLTTDAEDDPHHSLAHFNGTAGFLGIGGHRLTPVTHWQSLDAAPEDWKLPPPKPRNQNRRTAKKGAQ